MLFIRLWLVLCLMMVLAGCHSSALPPPAARPEVIPKKPPESMFQIQDFFLKVDHLTINEYEVVKVRKTTAIKGIREPVPVNVAVLKHQGTVLATFEGAPYPLGNAIDFALVSLLNDAHKELVISSTIPRGGRHWVVNFSPQPEVIFDSAEFQLGGEDLFFSDLDQDGMAELSMSVNAFAGFQNINLAESPRPEVMFKFDPVARQYQIANKLFRERLLQGIEVQRKHLSPNQTEPSLAARLDVLLRYVYAGEEAQGWAFFDAAYPGHDREEIKKAIKKVLAQDLVYKSLNQ
ncbi:MAG: hypothetical protein HY774_20675 [Acidobacteria bacterium]|nr:hypothetical protein [Acidobacteriota bacterium]